MGLLVRKLRTIPERVRFDNKNLQQTAFRPVEATERDLTVMDFVKPFTMTSPERVWALLCATKYVLANNVDGHLVEVGVWRGGSLITMGSVLQEAQDFKREIWGYDTFNGMTEPSEADIEARTGSSARTLMNKQSRQDQRSVWCEAGIDEVRANLDAANLSDVNFRLVQGDIRECGELSCPPAVSLLRLDTDWFDSTYAALTCFFPRLVKGGVCIVDDYGHWEGARKAVDQYLRENNVKPLNNYIDYTGRLFLRP